MVEVVPAILSKNYEDLKNKISLVRGLVPVAQIDICDGIFVKNTTWPFGKLASVTGSSDFSRSFDLHFQKIINEEEGLPFWEDIDFELDLMVSDAVENFDIYNKLGARRMVFHLEAVGDIDDFKHFLEGLDSYIRDVLEIGVAISPKTSVEKIFSLINYLDFAQVMGIDREGVQGESFDEKCLEHIKALKTKFPDLVISIDGAVNFETAPALTSAGADRLVIGSTLFNSDDIMGVIEEFKSL